MPIRPTPLTTPTAARSAGEIARPIAPTAPVLLAVVAGVTCDRFGAPEAGLTTALWLGVAVCGALAGVVAGRARGLGLAAVLVAWGALAGAWHHARWWDWPDADLALRASDVPQPAWLRGVVLDVLGYRPGRLNDPDDPGITRAEVEVFAVESGGTWSAATGRALLTAVGNLSDVRAGDAVELVGDLARPEPPLNPGEFDYRAYLQAQGIGLRLTVNDDEGVRVLDATTLAAVTPGGLWHVGRWRAVRALGAIRAWSQNRLARGLDPPVVPLAAALLLGRREGVDPDVNAAFARTGTTHLLAISGLHLQVLAVGLGAVLRGLGVPRRVTFAAVASAALGYAALVGLMPSVVRSVAMTVTACVAGGCDRRQRPANTLALAALVTLALNPAHLVDAGCQLSFLAVASIAWVVLPVARWVHPGPDPLARAVHHYQPRWRRLPRWLGAWLIEGLIVSVVVCLVGGPLVLLRFHLASPIGVLLNVPLIPITSLALLAAGLSLGLSAIWEPLGVPAGAVCSALLNLTERIVRWGAEVPWGHWFGPSPSWGWVLAFYILLGLTVWAGRAGLSQARWRILAGLTLATMPLGTLAMLGIGWPGRVGPEVEVLAVGHGLSVTIDLGGGRALLYDCGRLRDPSVGRRIIAPALWHRGVWRLDAVILSHADADHYNGLPDLLERFRIDEVVVPPGFGDDPAPAVLGEARRRGVPVRSVAAGDTLPAGPLALRFLHPPRDWSAATSTDNERSLVVDLAPRARPAPPHAWLTGDLDGPGLTAVADGYDRDRDGPIGLMLAPHHGGRSANPLWFYERLNPAVVVASQRKPSLATLDALQLVEERGLPVARTWQRGALTMRWTNREIRIHGFRDSESLRTARGGLGGATIAPPRGAEDPAARP